MSDSILDKLPLPKLEAYYEAPKKQYWHKAATGQWIQVSQEPIVQELESLGYNAKAPKGKKFSAADAEVRHIRHNSHIEYAGAVAGHMPGLKTYRGGRYLVTKGPELIKPAKGAWPNIKTLGEKLFPDGQFQYVLGWCQNAVKGLYAGKMRRGQLLVLAGPAGVGKTFWQERVITPILGGRSARPIQFMTGATTFNADIISSEHLLLSDEISKTDMKSRQAFGTAIKNFTVNPSQRIHGKGDNGFMVESSHWVTMSINDDTEALAILPPLEYGVKDKLIILKCGTGISSEWPGPDKKHKDELQDNVEKELAAFVEYLLNQHVVATVEGDEAQARFGVSSYLNPTIVGQIHSLSSGAHLEFLIDGCWEQMAKEGKKLHMKSEEIQLHLTSHPTYGHQARSLLGYPKACGRYLNELQEMNPLKYTAPSKHARGDRALWTIDWSV